MYEKAGEGGRGYFCLYSGGRRASEKAIGGDGELTLVSLIDFSFARIVSVRGIARRNSLVDSLGLVRSSTDESAPGVEKGKSPAFVSPNREGRERD